jgi:hypothetical protein
MKQWNVRVIRYGQHIQETIINARDYFEAKRIAAGMFNCKLVEVEVSEIR